ncbi:anti-sigma factor family protein [Streptomyces montanisoli]|uniref:Zf-HC2 domain-containing protein n=1 Tax=Streptomyces montanisoli TaxID=2798581 RepID=A0A940MGG2_9ACTN|nr:zf-HC2 domain-containing protein [Streptomyces montanisoli]MBP0460423.1 zf-HC2 domain-containing protein [Streptomyces montanisoli]
MTSPSETDQHPDVSEISEFTEGLLSSPRAAELRAHLDTCALCADVRQSLTEIRDLLGALPEPPRMDEDAAARIDAALAAEALLGSSVADDASLVPQVSVVPVPGPSPSAESDGVLEQSRVSRETSRLSRAPGGPPRSTTGPGRARAPRRRRGAAIIGATLGAAVIGAGVFLLQPSDASGDNTAAAQTTTSPRITATATTEDEFSGRPLETSVNTLLATKTSSAPRANPNARTASANPGTMTDQPMLGTAPPVPLCVRQGTGRSEAILGAEQGTYRGTPAYLLVLANPADESKVRVYVIDSTCVGSVPAVKGKTLFTETYPRR